MNRIYPGLGTVAAFGILVASGCGGSVEPPATLSAEPVLLGTPVVVAEETPAPVRAADVSPRDRWGSPFAVSAAGRVAPLSGRQVVVVDAHPAIAEGIARQAAVELNGLDRRPAAASAGRDREPASGVPVTDAAAPRAPSVESSAGAPTPRPADRPRTHRVERGDTWSAIAVRYQVPQRALAEANPTVDPNRIQIGQTLVIPGTD